VIIKGLQKLSVIDYPGKVSCTIFTFGCNFRCGYCHNPELVVDDGRAEISEEEILNFLSKRKDFLDGVCVTGGEPTINKDLPEFLSKIKKMGFSVKLDTNGSNPEMLEQLVRSGLVDYIAMDIKAPLEKYDDVTKVKVDKEKIKKSIGIIRKIGNFPEYEFRITVVPGLFNGQDALAIGKWLKGSKKFYIQNFRNIKTLDKSFIERGPFTKEELENFCDIMKPFFEECKIRGSN